VKKASKKGRKYSKKELVAVVFFLIFYLDTLLILLDPKIPLETRLNISYSGKILNITLYSYYAGELKWENSTSNFSTVDVSLRIGSKDLSFGGISVSPGQHVVGEWRTVDVSGGEIVYFCSKSILGEAGCIPVYLVPNKTVTEDYFAAYTWYANFFFTVSLGYCNASVLVELQLNPTDVKSWYTSLQGSTSEANMVCSSGRCSARFSDCLTEFNLTATLGYPPLLGGKTIVSLTSGAKSYISLRMSAAALYIATLASLMPLALRLRRRGGAKSMAGKR